MKKFCMIMTMMVFMALGAGAETERGNGISIGAALMDADGDFGFQGTVTSPWLKKSAALRAGAFYLYRDGEGAEWVPYYGFKAGLIGGSFMATGDIRLYGEGGVTFLFPSSRFDDQSFVFGGYGHFGFEFFVARSHSGLAYFFELGSNGIGAKAEKMTGTPVYMNGFATTVGLRYYPK